jgi:hypothetical protein
MRVIHSDRTPVPYYLRAERLDDREKSENITDTWDVVQSERIEKKSSCDERKGCILGA